MPAVLLGGISGWSHSVACTVTKLVDFRALVDSANEESASSLLRHSVLHKVYARERYIEVDCPKFGAKKTDRLTAFPVLAGTSLPLL